MASLGNGRVAVLCPTRDRPEPFRDMVASVRKTAMKADVLAYVDEDQREFYGVNPPGSQVVYGSRIGPVAALNHLVEKFPDYSAYGIITDDTTLNDKDWDVWVQAAMNNFPNRLAVVSPRHNLGEHVDMPFVSRNWIDVVGWYACPETYHFCWPILTGLIGEMTAIVHAPEPGFSITHNGLPHSNTDIREKDAQSFFTYVALKLPEVVHKLREAMYP